MIYFLYGEDTYRSREELRRMIEGARLTCLAGGRVGGRTNDNWFDFVRIDASDKQINVFRELKQTTNTVSMFSSKKMMIIENVFDLNESEQEEVLEFLKKSKIGNDKNITLIFWAESASSANGLQKYLKSKAECKEFKLLEPIRIKQWIKEFVENQKALIDGQAIDRIINCIGNDLWRLSNELNKLITYKMLDVRRPTLTVADTDLFIKPELDLKIFDLVDAIGYKNKAKALKLFNQHINEGDDVYYLLSMIVYQVRNLIKVKTLSQINANTKNLQMIANTLNMHPFVARKSEQQADNFTYEELKNIYHQLMTIDIESKLGKSNAQTALELLIIEFC